MTEQGQEGAAEDTDAGPSSATAEPGTEDNGADGDARIAPRARVVLVGPPGSGKSTIGRKLARELGVELYDTDAGIEAETGRTIPDIFATDGEPEFRRLEEDVVRRAVLEHDGVVSLGGGSVLSAHTREVLRDAVVVYLEISVAEGLRRTGSSTGRPLLNGTDPGAKYRELMRIRRPLYREVATVRVRTDGRSPGRVVRMILTKLGLESVRTDLEAERGGGATGSGVSGAVTSRPGIGSNRSRARRRARARAAATRRANTEQTGAAANERSNGGDRTRSATPQSGGDETATGQFTDATSSSRATGQAQGESTGSRSTGGRRSRRTRSRRGGARIRSTTSANRDADSRAGARAAGGERANTSGADTPDRPAGNRPGTSKPNSGNRTRPSETSGENRTSTSEPGGGNRTGSNQPDTDRSATQGDRARRGRPRHRSGRRKTNDQKESEQRT